MKSRRLSQQQATEKTIRLVGMIPTEVWNRIGTKLVPKLKSGGSVKVSVEFEVTVKTELAAGLEARPEGFG